MTIDWESVSTLSASDLLAKTFYEEHQDRFAHAAAQTDVAARMFTIATSDFDNWLVRQGLLDAAVNDFATSTKERRGATSIRNTRRDTLNASALKAIAHPGYVVGPNKLGVMRVRLLALYAQEAPNEIAHRIQASARHYERMVKKAVKLVVENEHVSQEDRLFLSLWARLMLPNIRMFADTVAGALSGAEKAYLRKQKAAEKLSKGQRRSRAGRS